MSARAARRGEARVDAARLRADLDKLACFGRDPAGGGLHRTSFSDADMAARRWLIGRMQAAGLAATLDGAGNVIGRLGPVGAPAVMIGSHLDSVPSGGDLDGALGVVAGLECARILARNGCRLRHPVEVVATSEEEGRFGGMFGIQALSGAVTREWLEAARDDQGVALTEAMRRQGLDPEAALRAARPPASLVAFLELHIEQGPVLEAAGRRLGIVEGISGVFHWTVRLTGHANHSGTTPMDLRRDALAGAAAFIQAIPAIIDAAGSAASRLTVGKIEARPGFAHTVAGEAEFSVVGRDLDESLMRAMAQASRARLRASADAHRLDLAIEEVSWLAPKPCHPQIIELFAGAAAELGIEALHMPSGAGHDTQVMTDHTRAGMIFVPSIGGISHAPEEATAWEDILAGANVLLNALWRLAVDD